MGTFIRKLASLLLICVVLSTVIPDIDAQRRGVAEGPANAKTKKPKTKRPTVARPTTATTTTTPSPTTPAEPEPPAIACITDREPARVRVNKKKKTNRQGKGLPDNRPAGDFPAPEAVTQPLPSCAILMDLLFIIDGSASMGPDHFADAIDGIKGIVEQLTLSASSGVKVGFIIFGSTVTDFHNFSANKNDVINALNNVVYPNSGTFTNLAIDKAINMFETSGRPTAQWLIIIVTDGRSEKPSKTLNSFNAAKNFNINVAAIGVTKAARQSEVYSSVSKNMQHFAKDFDHFRDKADRFLDKVCSVITD